MEASCIICKESSPEVILVGVKGRCTLVSSSLERRDGLHETFKTTTPLRIHATCRKQYTRKSSITSAKRKSECLEVDDVPVLRSSISKTFDIKSECLFCSEAVYQDERLNTYRKRAVSSVSTLEFQSSVLNCARRRNDKWGNEVAERVQLVYDLVAAEAKYHRQCAQSFLKERESESSQDDKLREEAFNELCKYLDSNDECQYSVEELLEHMAVFLNGDEGFSVKHLKRKLKQHYGDDIVITSIIGKSSIVSFRDSAHKLLHEKWIADKVFDAENQSDRIIDMAASIILDEIRLTVYDCDEYTSLGATNDGRTLIPSSLHRFLHKLVDGKGKSATVSDRRCTSIAHTIMSASRPRSFISPLLLGIAVYIHRRYASRELIDILSSMGFADDYREVQRFEHALLSGDEPSYDLDGFTQFVFDNADFNIGTVTGHNTFHSMGGIACVTPPGKRDTTPIKRKLKLPPAETVGAFGQIPIKTYSKPAIPGLQSTVVEPLDKASEVLEPFLSAAALDSLWVVGYVLELAPCPSWGGFMKLAMAGNQYQRSRIETLPFIILEPSNPSTIYTALCFAQSQCEKHGLRVCPVTFDQPLYIKAAEIVASAQELDKVIVRLGGFHLLMSYLGSIGYIMTGSGLEELWETVYAKGTIMHMLTGHAFSRALRAHILTSAALIGVLIGAPDAFMDSTDRDRIEELYKALLTHDVYPTEVAEEECIKKLTEIISQVLDQAASQSRTGKLWVQYIRQVNLLQHFLRAERTGDWKLHLSCVRAIIPHFHAAGHLHYAKAARLYLQQMEGLERSMPTEEYQLFTDTGYFTIRRSDSFWSGNFSDQTIEQFLMRTLKTSGGMTHGRGITDSTLTKWVHALPRCAPVCDALEQFTGVHTGTSEQHKDLRESTQTRDNKDRHTFVGWLEAHPPFAGYGENRLVSLSTGLVADSSVNCDSAVELGRKAASGIDGKKFTDISLRRGDKVNTISSGGKTVKVRGENVEINSYLLFNRITCVLNNSSEMEEFLAYELAPRPPSLFKDGAMRKPTKKAIGDLLKSFTQQSKLPENGLFVIDGGHLLHAVIWPQPSTYAGVCQAYISYVLKNYGDGSTVVFDGYDSVMSTKTAEQTRRAQKGTSRDIIFEENMPTTTSQESFLANSNNKKRFIQHLREKLLMAGIHVKQAEADADRLIVSTALALAETEETPAVVVGNDTDLLVMLVARASDSTDMFMLCRSKAVTVFRIRDIQDAIGDTKYHLMFLHAMSGCDTVSAIFRQGKTKAFNMVHKKQEYDSLDTFTNSESTHEDVERAGEMFILKLYGARSYDSLNKYRHIAYKRAIGRSSLSSEFQLGSLPPTSDAARQHSYRTYHTVQQWMGNDLLPTEWGWRLHDGTLLPVETTIPVAPEALLNMVSCGCKPDGCSNMTCSCKKLGLFCTSMCNKCSGQSCHNTAPELEGDDEEIIAPTVVNPNDVQD